MGIVVTGFFIFVIAAFLFTQAEPVFGAHMTQGATAKTADYFTIKVESIDETTILVTGHAPRTAGEPVIIKVTSPTGNVVAVDQLTVDSNFNYMTKIKTSKSWKVNGAYVITAYQNPPSAIATGSQSGDKSSLINAVSTKVEAFDGLLANFNLNYNINGGYVSNIRAEPDSNSLIITISTQIYNDVLQIATGEMKGGMLTIELPRNVIDAKISDTQHDDKFVVKVDGTDTKYKETLGSAIRTLTIPFPNGSEEIKITGTYVNPEFAITIIPEFGILAPLVLLASIAAIVVLSAKGKLGILYPKVL